MRYKQSETDGEETNRMKKGNYKTNRVRYRESKKERLRKIEGKDREKESASKREVKKSMRKMVSEGNTEITLNIKKEIDVQDP